jgi:hypothetical protein
MHHGAPEAIVGSTSQAFVVAKSPSGVSAYNSAYSPFYYSDSEQILRSDDLLGTNQIAYGKQGSGTGQFYGAYGIALDSLGRIYVADTYNGRVVRIDKMSGLNWKTYGAYGSGQGQFHDPQGIAVDSKGRIYIMDTGNSRLVRIDDMNGTNWTVFNKVGTGTGQVSNFTSVTVDTSSSCSTGICRIYIPDTGRIVRMDDMNGTNWTALTQAPGGTPRFSMPAAVAVDSAGKIYVADNGLVAPAVVRVDNMTGANWTTVYVSATGTTGLNSISVDRSQAVFTGGGGAKIINEMIGVLTSSGAVAPYGTYYVFGVTPVPLPSPVPSAVSLTPASLTFSQKVGPPSPAQTITVANFGGSPLNISQITAGGAFAETNNCPRQLQAGSNCTISVTFTPTGTGAVTGSLTVNDDSYNLGKSQSATLHGTVPAATATPSSLSFGSLVVGDTSLAQKVTLKNSGSAPLQVTSITAPAPFAETNTCGGTIAPSASCTISVTFTPTSAGSFTASLTISDNAGTQTVSVSGSGIADSISTQH